MSEILQWTIILIRGLQTEMLTNGSLKLWFNSINKFPLIKKTKVIKIMELMGLENIFLNTGTKWFLRSNMRILGTSNTIITQD